MDNAGTQMLCKKLRNRSGRKCLSDVFYCVFYSTLCLWVLKSKLTFVFITLRKIFS